MLARINPYPGIAMPTQVRQADHKADHIPAPKPRVSVRARIMILALLLIVPPMIDRVRLLENARTERMARAAGEVADLARRGAEAQAEIIASTRALLRLVGRAYGALANDQSCAALLSGFAADVPWIGGLSAVGPNDKISCSTRAASVGIDVSDRDYVRKARQSGDFVLSDYLIERADNGPAMIVAYPATGKDAIILAPIELQWVERFADVIDQRKGATAFLLDPRGTVLAQLPGRGLLAEQGAPDHPLIRTALAEERGSLTAAGLDGVRRIFAFDTLPGTNTRIVVGISEGEALGRIDRDISLIFFELALFGLLGMLLAWFCGERFILEPVRSLARTAASIGRGELEPRPTRDHWTMEFAPLASALTDMAKKLAERESELRAANHHLEELALRDGLSGLPNRRSFDARLAATWRAAEPKSPISLLMMDVDHFKLFNDSQGHLEGDNCLRLIGKTIEATIRRGDFAARYGGEEFVVLLPGADAAEAHQLAERARREIEALRIAHEAAPCGFVTLSVGIATFAPEEAASEQALIEAADAALYEAKRHGRNTVAVWAAAPPALAEAG
jgi:diguanylate cyclase (GGDEF)-like protein